jgi:hypothetical protein
LGSWERHLAPFTHVVGYSGLGHFFLHDENTGDFAVFHPFKRAYKNYGPFESVAAFRSAVLDDEGFAEYVLRLSHQAQIRERLGELGEEEVYIPQPYPFLGGTDAPDTYATGNVWVFAELVAMSHGLG